MLKYVPFYTTDISTKAATFATSENYYQLYVSTGSRMSDDSQTDKASALKTIKLWSVYRYQFKSLCVINKKKIRYLINKKHCCHVLTARKYSKVFKSLNPAIDCPWLMVGSNPGSGEGGELPYINHILQVCPPKGRVFTPQTFPILVWNRIQFSRELRECMNVMNEKEREMRKRNGF